MQLAKSNQGIMRGLDRSPLTQALANLENALRAAALVTATDNGMVPHPLDVVRAEIRNAQMYLKLVVE
jgi:hypothetical protein